MRLFIGTFLVLSTLDGYHQMAPKRLCLNLLRVNNVLEFIRPPSTTYLITSEFSSSSSSSQAERLLRRPERKNRAAVNIVVVRLSLQYQLRLALDNPKLKLQPSPSTSFNQLCTLPLVDRPKVCSSSWIPSIRWRLVTYQQFGEKSVVG